MKEEEALKILEQTFHYSDYALRVEAARIYLEHFDRQEQIEAYMKIETAKLELEKRKEGLL